MADRRTVPYLINGVGSEQDVYTSSAVAKHPIGAKGVTLDGRVFYYASRVASGTLSRGSLCTVATSVANHVSIAWASGGAAQQRKITVTLGATLATVNQYADGWITVIDGGSSNGQGQVRQIQSHPAAASGATLELTLYDALETTMAASEVTLTKNMFDEVILSPGNAQPIPAGWPAFDVPAGNTSKQHFWLQTAGELAALRDGSVFLDGSPLVPASAGTADAGQVTLGHESVGVGTANDPSDLLPLVGYAIEASDATSDGDHILAMGSIRW